MLTLGVLIVVAWQVPWLHWFVYPFRLFGTFVHELSHGLTALLTGGHFHRFEVQPDLSGVAWSAGGIRVLVASAGYVGSAIAGGVLILLHQRLLSARVLLIGLGVVLAVLCVLFVRNLFGVTTGLGLAALLLLAGLKLSESWRDALLITLALQLILDGYNSLFTVLSLSTVSGTHTDAHTMARLTFLPAIVWVLIWMGLSSFILYHALRWSFASSSRHRLPEPNANS
jgi:Peptidase M50B-like